MMYPLPDCLITSILPHILLLIVFMIQAQAKSLENKRLLNDAFRILHEAVLHYSQIATELEKEEKYVTNVSFLFGLE